MSQRYQKLKKTQPDSSKSGVFWGKNKPKTVHQHSAIEREADTQASELLNSIDTSWSSIDATFNDLKEAAEQRFGRDLQSVTLSHSDDSQQMSESLGAHGLTQASTIHLSPRTHESSRAVATTVAHEMIHAVQQTGGAKNNMMDNATVSAAPESIALRRDLALGEQLFTVRLNRIKHLLSYGFFDWAITDADATEAFKLLQGMSSTERATALGSIRVDRLQDNLPMQSQRDQLEIMLKQTDRYRTSVQDINSMLDTNLFDWAVTDAEANAVIQKLLSLSPPDRHYAVMGIDQHVLLDNLDEQRQYLFNEMWSEAQVWWNRQRQQKDPLHPGDEIKVRVYNAVSGDFEEDSFPDHTIQVSADNTINVPLIGTLTTVGQKPDHLALNIAEAISEGYLRKAVVSVEVVRRHGENFEAQAFHFESDQPSVPLEPGDTFTLMVVTSSKFQEQTDFSKPYHIDPGGSVELPHLGRIDVAGKTRTELISHLQERFSTWYKQPPIVWAWVRSHSNTVYREPTQDEKPQVRSQFNIQKSLDEAEESHIPERTPIDIYMEFYRQKSAALESPDSDAREQRLGREALHRYLEWVSNHINNEQALINTNPYSVYGDIYTPMLIGDIKRESRRKVEEERYARESAERSAKFEAKMDIYWRWAQTRWKESSNPFKSAGQAYLLTEHPNRKIAMDKLTEAVMSWAYANRDHPDFDYLTPDAVAEMLLTENSELRAYQVISQNSPPRLEYFPELDRTRRTLGHTAFEMIIGFMPILGEMQDANDLLSGVSITGEKLSGGERALAGIALFVPFVPASALRGGDDVAGAMIDLATASGRSIDEVEDVFRVAGNLSQADAKHIDRIMEAVGNNKKLSEADLDILDDIALKLKAPLEEVAEARKAGEALRVKPLRVDPLTNKALIPGSAQHKLTRWKEYQIRNGVKISEIATTVDPRWEKLYTTILANKRAGGKFESDAIDWLASGQLPGLVKNNEMMISTASGAKGFIPDGVKGNPGTLIWGQKYHFVEVKGWKNMSKTGNLKAMIEYVQQFGGHVEVVFRSANHADGATTLTAPLQRALDDLVRNGNATIRRHPP